MISQRVVNTVRWGCFTTGAYYSNRLAFFRSLIINTLGSLLLHPPFVSCWSPASARKLIHRLCINLSRSDGNSGGG